jgi:hypothetical protein
MEAVTPKPKKQHLFLAALLAIIASLLACSQPSSSPQEDSGRALATAFEQRKSDVQVQGGGFVSRVLSDDRKGSPHQRIVVRLASGQTVLIQHNIALAPRVDNIREGDAISFAGEYIWNEQGGLVHRTHHDPQRRHPGGWLKHNGRTYE